MSVNIIKMIFIKGYNRLLLCRNHLKNSKFNFESIVTSAYNTTFIYLVQLY